MYRTLRFGSTALPRINPVQDESAGPARLALIPTANGELYDAHGADQDPPDVRAWPYSGVFIGTDAQVHAAQLAWRALVGTKAALWREVYATGELQWTYARLRRMPATRRVGDRYSLKADFDFALISPTWYAQTQYDATWHDLGAAGDDLTTCHAESSSTGIGLTVINAGDLVAKEITLTFLADAADPLTGFTLTNSTTGHALTWAGTLAVGKSLVLDCGLMSILNDGTDDYASLTPPAAKERWMEFAPGSNTLTLDLTDVARSLRIQFYPPYA